MLVVNRALRRASPDFAERLLRGEALDPPSLLCCRCAPSFQAPPGRWRWLMEHLFVGAGFLRPDCVAMAFCRVT